MKEKFFLSVAIVWYVVYTTQAICPDTDYQCIQSQVCISRSKTCDFFQDCSDGSDESLNAGCESPTSIPSNLHVKSITSSNVTIEWDAINDKPEDRITGYQCQLLAAVGGYGYIITIGQSDGLVSVTFTGLFPESLYKFRVRAINLSGPGQYSSFVTAFTSSGVLGKVTSIKASPKPFFENSSVLLEWSPPIDIVGYTINSLTYFLTYCELNALTACTNLSMNSSTLRIELSNLKSNYIYNFTITPIAKNVVGVKVGVPTGNIFQTALRASCNPDTYYTCVQDQSCVLKSSICNGVFDCADKSDETAAASCSLPTSAPLIDSIVALDSSSIAIFFSVIKDPSERVQYYSFINTNTSVEQRVDNINLQPSVSTLSVNFTGLSTGVFYFFKGKAVNPSGDGPYSGSYGVMLQTSGSIGAVRNVTIVPVKYFETTTVRISWSPPPPTDGEEPSTFQYIVSYCDLDGLTSCVNSTLSSELSVTLTNLKAATSYRYTVYVYDSQMTLGQLITNVFRTADRVTCQDSDFTCVESGQCISKNRTCDLARDCSDNSDELAAAGCAVPVSTPSGLRVTNVTATSITMGWDAINGVPQDRLTSYECQLVGTEVILRVNQDVGQNGPKSVIFGGLSPDSVYVFRVRAVNPSGAGPWSSNVTVNTSAGVVGEVSDVVVTPTLYSEQTSVLLQWGPPSALVGYNASSLAYVVTYCELNVLTTCLNLTTNSSVLRVRLSGLKANSLYQYSLRAVASSTSKLGTLKDGVFRTASQGSIGAVFNVTYVVTKYSESNSVKISWSPPQSTGGEDPSTLHYLVSYCELNVPASCLNTSSLSGLFVVISGLKSSSFYQFSVYVFSSQMVFGQYNTYVFKTADRDTCLEGFFACVSNGQCILKNRTCNLIQDCADYSDEKLVAGCSVPSSVPSNLHSKGATLNYIVMGWDVVKDFLKERITGYQCQLLESGFLQNVAQNLAVNGTVSIQFFGLLPDSFYTFRVRAVNPSGSGTWSSNIVAYTNSGTIGIVTNVALTLKPYFEDSAVLMEWNSPQELVGYETSNLFYLVTYCEQIRENTCKNISTNSSTLKTELSGLMPDTTYTYSLTPVAVTTMKVGKISAGNFRTALRPICNSQIQFTCVQDRGCVLKEKLCDGNFDCIDQSDETAAAMCPLPTVNAMIASVNAIDEESLSVVVNVINDTSQRINFYIVENVNTSLKIENDSPIQNSSSLKFIFNGLLSNRVYLFRVRVQNPSGPGPWSSLYFGKTIKAAHIGVVSSMTAVPVLYFESSSVKFSWKAPINDNGDNVLDFKYLVTYCELNLPQTCKNTTLTRDLFAVVENLLPNTSYMYTITPFDSKMISGDANNDTFKTLLKNTCNSDLYFTCVKDKGCVLKASLCDGVFDCEDESDETSSAMCSLPVSKPSIGTFVEETPLVLKVTWNLIESPKERIQSYEVEIVGFSSQAINVSQLAPSTKSLNATFIGVSPNQMFFVRVRAINPSGFGPWSDSLNITTVRVDVELIGPVQEYSAKPVEYMESTSFMVFWKPPLNLGRNKAVYYRVLLCSLNIPCENLSSRTTNANISFSGLTPNFLYQYTIFVYNENDETNASLASSSAFKTLQKDSCPPQYFACTSSPGCVLLSLCCNNIVDCVDGSDEKIDANCSLPSEITGFKMSEKNDSSVTVQFDAIIQPQERVLSYEVENLVNNDVKTVYQELKAYYPPILVSFNNLSSATFYSFRVRSRNLSGYSKWSILLNLTTTGCAATIYAISVAIPVQNITSASNFTMQHENLTFSYFGSFDNMKSGWNSAQRAGLSVGFFVIASLVGVGGTLLYRRSLSSKKGVVNNEDGDIIELS